MPAVGHQQYASNMLRAHETEEGGALTLIARSVALGGLVTARGGTGQDAVTEFPERDALGPDSLGGGGGGSGGGIAIITRRLDVCGQLNVAGGEGGVGNGPDGTDGAHGSAGCVKLFADEIHAPPGAFPIVGPAFVDRPLPSDPVAPPSSAAVLYVAQTHHTLAEPFPSYWRKHGGLPIFGYPQTEAFDAGLTWSQSFQPPAQDNEATGVALDPRHPAHIWLGTVVSGVYRSTDAGHTWAHVGGKGFLPHVWVYALAVSPYDSRLVYVSTIKGLYRTSDDGKTWSAVSGPWSLRP
jgi:hypothetical protein